VENLLDLELGGGAADESVPSPTAPNNTTSNILDDLGSLSLSASPATAAPPPSQLTASPPVSQFNALSEFGSPPPNAATNNMNDLLGIFGGAAQNGGGFGGENVWSDIAQQNGPQTQQTKSKTNEDILGLF
jgi:hypothetical protein